MRKKLLTLLLLPSFALANDIWSNSDHSVWLDSNGYYCEHNSTGDVLDACLNISSYKIKEYDKTKTYLVWTKVDYAKPTIYNDKKIDSVVSKIAVNCNQNVKALARATYYYKGSVVTKYNHYPNPLKFADDAPGTVGEHMTKMVCEGLLIDLNTKWHNKTIVNYLNSNS